MTTPQQVPASESGGNPPSVVWLLERLTDQASIDELRQKAGHFATADFMVQLYKMLDRVADTKRLQRIGRSE